MTTIREETIQRAKDGYAKVASIPLFVNPFMLGQMPSYKEGMSFEEAQVACGKHIYGDDFIAVIGNTYGRKQYGDNDFFDLCFIIWAKVDDPKYGELRVRKNELRDSGELARRKQEFLEWRKIENV